MKKIIFFYLLLVFSTLSAQSLYTISGRVIEENTESIPYAVVSLMDKQSQKAIVQTTTDANGYFSLSAKSSEVQIVIFASGYESYQGQAFFLQQNIQLGNIILKTSITELSDVVVTASSKKPVVRLENGKIIFSPKESAVTLGGNAFDALKKIPGVLVDNTNTISIMGKKGTVVFINGKSTYMQAEDLASFLKSISASQIKNIEILLNPSAQYDAEGSSGIINIVLSKTHIEGTFLSVGSGISYWKHTRNNTDISLQHNTKKQNINFGYNHQFGNIDYNYGSDRRLDDNWYISSSADTDRRKSISANLGTDIFLNDKNTIGVNLTANTLFGKGNIYTQNDIYDKHFTYQKTLYGQSNYTKQKANRYGVNTFYEYRVSDEEKYNVDIDYIFFDGVSVILQPNWHKEINTDKIADDTFLADSDRKVHIFAAAFHQKFPLWEGKWSSGIKFSQVKTHNRSDYLTVLSSGNLLNASRSNTFDYQERLLAAYLQSAYQLSEKLSAEIGIRSEYTFAIGKLFPRQGSLQSYQENKRQYPNFFPFLNLTYQQNEKNSYALSYSKRIARPAYQDLSPFIQSLDGLSDWVGNPFLEPQKIQKLTTSATWYKTTAILSYTFTDDYSGQITEKHQNQRVIMIPRNIGHQNYFSVSILQEIQWTSWYKMHLNSSIFYMHNVFSIPDYVSFSPQKWTFTCNSQHQFKLPWHITGEVNTNYYSNQIVNANEITKPSGFIDIGLQRSFWDNQLSVSLSFTDIFHTQRWDSESHLPNLDNYIWGYGESRQVKCYLTYKIGKQKEKISHQSDLNEAERL